MSWEPEDIAAYKDSRRDTQGVADRIHRRGTRANPGRKTLLDRLTAARASLLFWIDHEMNPSWGISTRGWRKWAAKRYAKALQDCWDAGIDIKA